MSKTLQYASHAGIGLRSAHVSQLIAERPAINWLEVHAENYFAEQSGLSGLKKLREDYQISLHGVGLSLGSTEPLNMHHLQQLKNIVDTIDPLLISEHLAFCRVGEIYFHDLLPLPFTSSAIDVLVEHIQIVQDYLKRPLLVENITRYTQFATDEMTEADFICEIARRSGCFLLIDLTNAYVNAHNLQIPAAENFLLQIPKHLIREIHLSGYSKRQSTLIDSHSQPIPAAIWTLYAKFAPLWGAIPTIIEWDAELPSLATLLNEAHKIKQG